MRSVPSVREWPDAVPPDGECGVWRSCLDGVDFQSIADCGMGADHGRRGDRRRGGTRRCDGGNYGGKLGRHISGAEILSGIRERIMKDHLQPGEHGLGFGRCFAVCV